MKTLKLLIAIAALAISGTALAGAPWTYVDLGLNTADSSSFSGSSSANDDDRTTGFGLRGSIGTNLFHAGLNIEQNEWAGGKDKAGADETGYDVWVGLHPAMGEKVDLVLDLGYASSEFETISGSTTIKDDVNALYLRTGPRALIANEKLELFGYVTLATGENKFFDSSGTDWTGVGYTVGGGATLPLASMVSLAFFVNYNAGSYAYSAGSELHRFTPSRSR